MAVKWDAGELVESLDKIESIVIEIEASLGDAMREALRVKEQDELPQYVIQRIDRLVFDLRNTLPSLTNDIDSVRKTIPDSAEGLTKKREYSQKNLFESTD